MTQVLLINPPIYFRNQRPISLDTSYPPLGLLYLASYLNKNNISVKVIDTGAQQISLNSIVPIIKKERIQIVGITSMTATLQGTVSIAKVIKSKCKNLLVGVGGSHVSADPDFIKRIKYFDFAIQGESEITFLNLIRDFLKSKKVTGIYQGQVVKNIDNIPWPNRSILPSKAYLKKADLIATRGCPFNCYFCSRPAVSNCVRCRSAKDIVDEMDSIYSSCNGDYQFQDDSLTIKKDHIIKLSKELIKRPRKYRWEGYTRIDLVDEDIVSIMAKAGCHNLTFGIESGDEKLRKDVIKKPFSNQQIKNTIKLCQKHGITTSGFFIIGHYSETKSQVKKTLDFILNNDFDIIGVSIATPFPGSKLWDYAVKQKIIDHKFIDDFALGKAGRGYAGVYPVYHPANIDLKWLYTQRKYIMRKFYLRPKFIFNRFIKDVQSPQNLLSDIKQGFSILLKGSSSRAPYKKANKAK